MLATPPAHDIFGLSIAESIALSQRHKGGTELLWFYNPNRLLYRFGVVGSIIRNRFRHLVDGSRFVSIPDPPGREDCSEFDRRVVAHMLVLRSHGEIPPEETMRITMILLCGSSLLSFKNLEKLLGLHVAYLITEMRELFDSTALSRAVSLVIPFGANCILGLIEDRSEFWSYDRLQTQTHDIMKQFSCNIGRPSTSGGDNSTRTFSSITSLL